MLPGGVGLEDLHGLGGVGHDQDCFDPALVEAGGVAHGLQHPGEVGDGGVDAGDGGEVGADVEAADAVFGGPGGFGEGVPGGCVFAGGGGVGVGGDDGGFDQGLEPGPGQPPVRGLRDPGIHIGGLGRTQVSGLAGHVAGMTLGDPQRLDPCHSTGSR